jgi:hypothetical protein
MEECERDQVSCIKGALADKIVEIAQTVTPPTLLPKASLFDFHENNLYIKSLNIRML